MSRQIVLDTETTGLLVADGHRLIEIGCLELINRRFTGKQFHYYINPQRLIDQGAFQVHGISNDFLQDKPLFSQIAAELLAFIAGAELIIHNAVFDMGFLNAELKRHDKDHPPLENLCTVLDTLMLARQKHPGQSNSLDALCRRYQIDNAQRDLHGALLDAKLLAQVYLAMTGGQEQLFSSEDHSSSQQKISLTTNQVAKTQAEVFLVTLPTEAELLAHQDFLNMLMKKGNCLWSTEI